MTAGGLLGRTGRYSSPRRQRNKANTGTERQNERERRQREQEERQAEDERRRREEYDRKAKVAGEFLQMWRKSEAFRELAAAIEEKVKNSRLEDGHKEDILAIAKWIAGHAENLDPLTDFESMIDEFKNPHSEAGNESDQSPDEET